MTDSRRPRDYARAESEPAASPAPHRPATSGVFGRTTVTFAVFTALALAAYAGIYGNTGTNQAAPPITTLAPVAPHGGGTSAPLTLGASSLSAKAVSSSAHSCPLPAFDASEAGQQEFFDAEVHCLNAAWKPALRAAGLPFTPPQIQLVTSDTQTPCGTRSPTQPPLYCRSTIYMTAAYYRDVEGQGGNAGVYFGQLAHEYGHHVQQLAGILDASWQQRYAVNPRSPQGYEISRRFELQATCFGGMFLHSATVSGAGGKKLTAVALDDAGQRGDDDNETPPEHGTPEDNATWVRQGYQDNRADHCDTWLVSPVRVL